jgi:hypothetical protein
MPKRCSAAHHGTPFLLLFALLALAGCSESSDKGGEGANHDDGSPGLGRAVRNESSDGPASMAPGPGSFGSGAAGTGSAAPMSPGGFDGLGAEGASSEPGDGSGDPDAGTVDPIDVEPGQLTAGEWSDLENWSFWRDLHQGEQCNDLANCEQDGTAAVLSEHWGYDTAGRFAVRVTSGGDPVIDAAVQLRDEQGSVMYAARTDSRGRAELFAGLFAESTGDYALRVEAAGEMVELTDLEPTGAEPIAVEFPVAHAPPPSLDLMFVVDTTGSMGDELEYIQAELGSVIEQVRDEIGSQLAVRLSVNFYRDRGDEYVVRDFQFTSQIDQALDQLSEQSAGGGGDTPEAVEEALDNAVNDHTWSQAATARLLFFVLDAPPHYDEGRMQSLHDSTRAAAEQGVQIIPLAASGIDTPTEFLLRMLAIGTNGTYTFLTDHSGIGNSHLEPTIGQYDVELLDELMVRVIRERL